MPTIPRDGQFGPEAIADARDARAVGAMSRPDRPGRASATRPRRPCRHRLLVLAFGLVILAPTPARPDEKAPARPDEKATPVDVVRTTVQIRNGTLRGSGTILFSIPHETLILTAAHVVHGAAALQIELHRHNFGGRTNSLSEGGRWPRLVPATLVAADAAADVAVVRIAGMTALPHVARFDPDAGEPATGDVVTSVGIDRTLFLTRWQTTAQGTALIDVGRGGGGPRRFIVTTRPPEHGRSGGGLYRGDGAVIGVCVGQLNLKDGEPKRGIFASVESIRRLLRENGLDRALSGVSPPRRRPPVSSPPRAGPTGRASSPRPAEGGLRKSTAPG